VERFWAGLLSRDAAQIRAAWATLSAEEAAAVAAHLQRMARDEGYSEAQRDAALAALAVLNSES
jgi:hypothetical protein